MVFGLFLCYGYKGKLNFIFTLFSLVFFLTLAIMNNYWKRVWSQELLLKKKKKAKC